MLQIIDPPPHTHVLASEFRVSCISSECSITELRSPPLNFLFLIRLSLSCSGHTGTPSVAQGKLKLVVLLFQSPE